jgi:hypothetical protein
MDKDKVIGLCESIIYDINDIKVNAEYDKPNYVDIADCLSSTTSSLEDLRSVFEELEEYGQALDDDIKKGGV